MEINIVKNNEDFLTLKEDWELLQKEAEQITFYSTFYYLSFWWDFFGKESKNELCVICVSEKGRIIGIAPLMIEKRTYSYIPCRILKFLGRADFFNFLIHKDVKAASLLRRVFESINKDISWDKLELTHIPSNTQLSHFLLKSENYNEQLEFLGENPVLSVKAGGNFDKYKKDFFKKNINYYRNKLRKDHEYVFQVFSGNEDGILEEIAEVHKKRNKDRISLFNDSKRFNHIKSLYQDKDLTRTFVLRSKEKEVISYATCYLYDGVLHNWNTSFDLKFSDYSAGDLIYLEMIQYAFQSEDTFEQVDFGAGRYPWKFRMTNTFVPTYRLNLNNSNSKKYVFLKLYDKVFKIGKVLLNKT